MSKAFWILVLAGLGLLVGARPSYAVYVDPITHAPITTAHSACVLTPDPTQKNATTVYTLNIDLTQRIELAYYTWWGRYARCDELQFHAEHNTSFNRLSSWLSQTEIQRYKNHFYDGLVKTHTQGTYANPQIWRLINGKRQRVYDWPTQMAWGLVSRDMKSVNIQHSNEFFAAYPEIAPLKYSDGQYKQQVDEVWNEGTTDINVPDRLQTELVNSGLGYGFFKYRDACSQFIRGCASGYDWRFLLSNTCIWNDNNPICDE